MTTTVYSPAVIASGLVRSGIVRLAGTYPFHSRVLERFCLRPDPAVGTFGVSVRGERLELVFAPDFVLSITADELGGVLLHEVMHVVLGHVTADQAEFPDRHARTIAEEVTVNEFIREPLPGEPIVLAMFPKLPPNESTAERYRRLAGRVPRKLRDSLEEDSTASALMRESLEQLDNSEPQASSDNAKDEDSVAGQNSPDKQGTDQQSGVSTEDDTQGDAGDADDGDGSSDSADADDGQSADQCLGGKPTEASGSSAGDGGQEAKGGPATPGGNKSGGDSEGNAAGEVPGDSKGSRDGSSGTSRNRGRSPTLPRTGKPGLVDNHDGWPSTPDQREVFRASLADLIADVVASDVAVPIEIAEALHQCGITPGQGAYLVRGESSGNLDWRRLLRRYVGRVLRVEPRYGRPPRRFPELAGVVPGRGRAEGEVSVVAVIDTSGSMSDPLLEAVAGELRHLGRHHAVHVVECDCVVHRTYRFRGRLEQVEGRGGTDFRPPLAWEFLRRLHPRVVVVFTDGDGPAPDEPPPVPVVWCLTPGGHKPVEWGQVIEMKLDAMG